MSQRAETWRRAGCGHTQHQEPGILYLWPALARPGGPAPSIPLFSGDAADVRRSGGAGRSGAADEGEIRPLDVGCQQPHQTDGTLSGGSPEALGPSLRLQGLVFQAAEHLSSSLGKEQGEEIMLVARRFGDPQELDMKTQA